MVKEVKKLEGGFIQKTWRLEDGIVRINTFKRLPLLDDPCKIPGIGKPYITSVSEDPEVTSNLARLYFPELVKELVDYYKTAFIWPETYHQEKDY